jgi:hypothetical protein
MPSIKHEIRNEAERGIIVQTLVDWGLEWIPFREVKLQLIRRAGYMLDDAKVEYHLQYLQGAGYAEVKTLRAGRVQVELTAVRGTPKAVDLVEGRSTPDPGVAV